MGTLIPTPHRKVTRLKERIHRKCSAQLNALLLSATVIYNVGLFLQDTLRLSKSQGDCVQPILPSLITKTSSWNTVGPQCLLSWTLIFIIHPPSGLLRLKPTWLAKKAKHRGQGWYLPKTATLSAWSLSSSPIHMKHWTTSERFLSPHLSLPKLNSSPSSTVSFLSNSFSSETKGSTTRLKTSHTLVTLIR